MGHSRLLSRVVACALCLLVQRAAMVPARIWPQAGVVVVGATDAEQLGMLGPVWYYQYHFSGAQVQGHLRVLLVNPYATLDQIGQAAKRQSGQWWLVGNEPNDPHQDNLSPQAYAGFYHRTWSSLRRADPRAHVVPAGIASADWRWADAFRESYKAQYGRYPQVAAWNIHNYILEPDLDQLDLDEFERRILAFRGWMERVGEDETPLLLTEFGVLYGTESLGRSQEDPEEIKRYIRSTVEWLAATEHVQAWAWFANYTEGRFNGDLYEATGQLSQYGLVYRDAIAKSAAATGAP
ncbi:MAG: hypothetical protein JXA74_13390 [Anaerolineae bacterium]|nr:hypothetical protein [Anaerolineae bacterium]